MKEFLKTNTITYNLMSFTAFKSMIIFSLLLDSPKSYKEIQEYLKNHEYIKELNKKLQEELQEYLNDENIEELADLEEVILAILDL